MGKRKGEMARVVLQLSRDHRFPAKSSSVAFHVRRESKGEEARQETLKPRTRESAADVMEGKLPEPQLSNLTEEPLSGKTEGPLPQVTVPEVSERLEHPVWPVYLQRRYPSQ
ncbi:hypothetical protein RRG08_057527, partial [Elysia crispata]